MRRLIVPGVPFAVSLLLSACTIGAHVGWQDSGFYLAAVKDLGVLYPPGFVLYLLLCKTWTLALGFLDFTLAVHLFSATCAAAAAGTLAVAARNLLQGRWDLEGLQAELPAIAAGCLAASGFTFWSAALLAKGYAFYYLVLSLLIWRLIRADETGLPRDFNLAAAFIGLAWAAHPSAVGLAPALILFLIANRRALDGKRIAIGLAIAAACAIGPSLLLPVLAARHSAVMFGNPTTAGDWLAYLTGSRFTGLKGVFGLDGFRCVNVGRYLWEDFLGVGLLLAVAGLARLAVSDRRLLAGILAWTLPLALLATLFRIEGQQDFWLAAAWLPLHLAVAVALAQIPARFAGLGLPVAALGLVWAAIVNIHPVSTRQDTLAEDYGRFHLERVERDAILILESDDTLATTMYLQVVKGLRPDVVLATASRFGSDWYVAHLQQRHPRLKGGVTLQAFAEANAAQFPVYFEAVPLEMAASAVALQPAGPYLRMGSTAPPAPWEFPVRMDELRSRRGRERGIRLRLLPDGLSVEPESYEQRWISAYVRAQAEMGRYHFKKGGDENLRLAAQFYEAARAADPDRPDRDVLNGLASAYYILKQPDRAEPLFKQLLGLQPTPRQAVRACSFLSQICQSQGRTQEAQRYHDQGMAIVLSDPELRRELERR